MKLRRNKKAHPALKSSAIPSDPTRSSRVVDVAIRAVGSFSFADVLRRLRTDDAGQDMVEYALLAGVVVGITISATPSVFVAVAELLGRIPDVMDPIVSQ